MKNGTVAKWHGKCIDSGEFFSDASLGESARAWSKAGTGVYRMGFKCLYTGNGWIPAQASVQLNIVFERMCIEHI